MFYSIDVQTRIIQNPKINQVQSEFEIKILGQNSVYGDFAKCKNKILVQHCGFENTWKMLLLTN